MTAQQQVTAILGGHRTVTTVSVDYPADAVVSLNMLTHPDDYFTGLSDGVAFTESLLRQRDQTCPHEQIVLAGYSQGAMVMHRVLDDLDLTTSGRLILARLSAALLIGDGDRVPNDNTQYFGSMHQSRRGIGLAWTSQSGSSKKKFPAALGASVLEVCNRNDPICDYPGLQVTTHFDYPDSAALADASSAASHLVLALPLPTPRVVTLTVTPNVAFQHQLVADVDSRYDLRWGLGPGETMPAGLVLSKTGLVSGTSTRPVAGETIVRVHSVILGVAGPWVSATLVWVTFIPTVLPVHRVSLADDGSQGESDSSGYTTISADDRHIAFTSESPNLVAGDTNGVGDVFVRDLQSGTVVRVDVASDGTQANQGAFAPAISADGRFVAFTSRSSNLAPDGQAPMGGVFVHDMQTGATTQVDVASDGTPDNFGFSVSAPAISADGRYVAFASRGSNLVPGDDSPGYFDVFRHDLVTGTTIRVSVAGDGTPGNGHSEQPTISADGNRIAFASEASNLVPDDTNGSDDIFVHDVAAGTTTRVDVSDNGDQADTEGIGDGQNPLSSGSISADGTCVVFTSLADNLVPDDTNNTWDVFVRNLDTQTTVRVSVSSQGVEGNKIDMFASLQGLPSEAISADDTKVTFWSESTNLVPGDTNGMVDVFVHDLASGETTRASLAADGTQPTMHSLWPTISPDGRYVLFDTAAPLVPDDTNDYPDIYSYGS